MVDWDRVEQLRSKGWEWDDIADDPKVGFTADSGAGDPGRALRVLYHRRRSKNPTKAEPQKKSRKNTVAFESKWTLLRAGYILVPVFAIWFIVAFLAPSPVGLILPAIPYIALGLAVVAFILIYALLRAEKRWTKVYRNTLIGGIVLGLVFTGVVGLTGSLAFGCPYLPPSTSLSGGSRLDARQHRPLAGRRQAGGLLLRRHVVPVLFCRKLDDLEGALPIRHGDGYLD
jgi:hypothetical protein